MIMKKERAATFPNRSFSFSAAPFTAFSAVRSRAAHDNAIYNVVIKRILIFKSRMSPNNASSNLTSRFAAIRSMDEYQDYAKFDENGERDWEDGQWIDGEFVSRGLKRGRQQSKDDAIYGIFGDDSDDDDQRDGKSMGKRGMGRKKSDFTRPVGFVSKGVNNSKGDVQYTSVDVKPPGGGQGEGDGLGFRPSFAPPSRMTPQEEDDDEREVLTTALGSRIKKQVAERRQAGHEERETDKQWNQVKSTDPSFATFEKHTKGIGMKLLAKMGFKPGEGLGSGKGGIVKPIEVQVRPKGQALGFGSRHRDDDDDDEGQQRVKESGKASTSHKAPALDQKRGGEQGGGGGRMWKKKNKEVRMKREYRTAEEVCTLHPSP